MSVLLLHPHKAFVDILNGQLLPRYAKSPKFMNPKSQNETHRRLIIAFSNTLMEDMELWSFYVKMFFDRIQKKFDFLKEDKTFELLQLSLGDKQFTDKKFLMKSSNL
jgi:hypothetical protein